MSHKDEVKAPAPTNRRLFLKQTAALGAGLAAGAMLEATGMASPRIRSRSFLTGDGVQLSYLEAGRGRPLVMIPGWSQTAAMFEAQIQAFSNHYHVYALDMRGHGDSEKTARGYRIARLAHDVHEFLQERNLDNVILAGHSMGCSVIWSYWERYGRRRIRRLLLLDQPPALTAWPTWTEQQIRQAGALFTPQSVYDIATTLSGPDGLALTEVLVKSFFSSDFPPDRLAWALQENLKLPREYAARLVVDHCAQDWRDVIPTIDVPTLVTGGELSNVFPESQQWVASQIPNAQLRIFTAAEKGSHFVFVENPSLFNEVVLDFLRR